MLIYESMFQALIAYIPIFIIGGANCGNPPSSPTWNVVGFIIGSDSSSTIFHPNG